MHEIILGNAKMCLCKVGAFDVACPFATVVEIAKWEGDHAIVKAHGKEDASIQDPHMEH